EAAVQAITGRRDVVPGEQRQRDIGDLHRQSSQARRSAPNGSFSTRLCRSNTMVGRVVVSYGVQPGLPVLAKAIQARAMVSPRARRARSLPVIAASATVLNTNGISSV